MISKICFNSYLTTHITVVVMHSSLIAFRTYIESFDMHCFFFQRKPDNFHKYICIVWNTPSSHIIRDEYTVIFTTHTHSNHEKPLKEFSLSSRFRAFSIPLILSRALRPFASHSSLISTTIVEYVVFSAAVYCE